MENKFEHFNMINMRWRARKINRITPAYINLFANFSLDFTFVSWLFMYHAQQIF